MKSYTYYLSSHTSEGYISFFDETIQSLKKIIILKNISAQVKEELFSVLKIKLHSLDLNFDIVLRPGTISEISAIIVPEISATVACEELLTQEPPLYSDVIDFTEKTHYDAPLNISISAYKNDISALLDKVYVHLKNAKKIHDELEKIYISNMDFDCANSAVNSLASELFSVPDNKDNCACEKRRFFGTLHPRTNINYIDELTADMTKRIFVDGRPGSGKSSCLKKLAKIALEKGYDVERYCCSLDPDSLDMIVVRDLGICMFDCTEPHKKSPVGANDEVFDIYGISRTVNVDELYKEEILYNTNMYDIEIKKAKECLYSAFLQEKYLDKILFENCRTDFISKVINMILL